VSDVVGSALTRVDVQTDEDGSLLVQWQLEGAPVPVDIATGPTPESVDHQHQITVGAGETYFRLPSAGRGRWFVSVSPHTGGSAMVAADRRVAFEGISNFRDLGGYRSRVGGTIRWGKVFRADALHGMSAKDLGLYQELGLRAVFDLRAEVERTERPNPVPSRLLTILGRPEEDGGAPAALPTAEAMNGERFLYELYAGMVRHSAAEIGELFNALAEDDGLPAVFHCHAGKDRTGLVAARPGADLPEADRLRADSGNSGRSPDHTAMGHAAGAGGSRPGPRWCRRISARGGRRKP
jgi:protein-tyrosine phosphatase